MNWSMHPLQIVAHVAATSGIVLITSCGTAPPSLSGQGSGSSDPSQTAPHVSADSEPGHCSGRAAAVSVDGDVTVPDGATCELLGTHVEGNVSIGHTARLYASSVDVDGDIEGERTLAVEASHNSTIGGNLQLESGGTALVTDSHVDGDLSWEDQHGDLEARDKAVRGNLELEGNTGHVTVSQNRIGGDLSCQDNSPAPQGRDNTVSGDEEQQCHDL